MERRKVGTVKALWRFPVKSMQGEQLDELHITARGVVGDRAWALRDLENRRIASAKKFVGLLKFHAHYEGTPEADNLPPVKITLPDGRDIHADDANASEAISEALGHGFHLEHSPNPTGERAGIDPTTIFADNPIDKVIPGLSAEQMPDYFALHKGSYLDSASFHLISTGTLAHMRDLTEGKSDFDYRRFRANLLVDTGDDASGFVEDRMGRRHARNRRRREDHLDRAGAAMRDDYARATGPAARPRDFTHHGTAASGEPRRIHRHRGRRPRPPRRRGVPRQMNSFS